jgi:hypothetical protein
VHSIAAGANGDLGGPGGARGGYLGDPGGARAASAGRRRPAWPGPSRAGSWRPPRRLHRPLARRGPGAVTVSPPTAGGPRAIFWADSDDAVALPASSWRPPVAAAVMVTSRWPLANPHRPPPAHRHPSRRPGRWSRLRRAPPLQSWLRRAVPGAPRSQTRPNPGAATTTSVAVTVPGRPGPGQWSS